MTDLETAKRQVEVLINALSPDERVRVLLAYCVGRLMLRDARRGIPLRENTPSLDDLSHVTDWLSSAVIDDAPWLLNVDHAGRPKKLMKFTDFDGMKREADKAIRIAAQRLVGRTSSWTPRSKSKASFVCRAGRIRICRNGYRGTARC